MKVFFQVLGLIVLIVFLCLFFGNIDHPERIGEWFGKIVNGFKESVK